MTRQDQTPSSTTTWSRWKAEAVRPRLLILRHLPVAGVGLVTTLVVVNLLLGLLPIGFVVATSALVGEVPGAVAGGEGSDAWRELVRLFVLAAAAFVVQQVLAPVQLTLGEIARRRVDGHVHQRLIGISMRSTGIGPMEQQDSLDALKEASRRLDGSWETPGMACAGLIALVARYTSLVGYCVLVGAVVSSFAGAALLVTVLVFRYGNRGGLRKYSQAWSAVIAVFRRATYLRTLALSGSAAKELRVFGLTGWLGDRYADAHRQWLAPVWRARRRIYLLPYLAYTAIGLAVSVLVFVALARTGAAGSVTLAELAIGLQATMGALMLGGYYPESDDATQLGMLAAEGMEKLDERVARHDTVPSQRGTVDPASLDVPSVRFEGVRFHYPGSRRPVHDGLDLELEPGRCTALVGINGAGKTTLVKLLTRLYEPTSGTIRFGGVDLREMEVDRWRRQVSVVFQEFLRFELSAADNIALGAVHVPRDETAVRRAAERAGIRDVLESLPHGFETPLSRAYTGGVDLSGGQWQRVAIARAFYALEAGARLLVLDEPTSALDVRAEARFFEQFVERTRGATSLLISHRFSSVRHADRIIVLEHGRVLEQGTHDELEAAGGRYAELFHLQAERFTQDDVPDERAVTTARGAER
ncbi:ABC transporter ATP-binding protein [Cellulomonas wangsupingiae]|uniref:ABC transporter ATP-binding protein n=1 Tax=Cellulomonas wangsupingiae TaxID=2968085 RepID=UPI001D0F0D3C|nr:ABC transporter ATP-binding protein [Cellulomonas wangsupingiae]MCM0640392.1 ABC transporter ATP-binding protein/permease [Cellulomonas wangsupingiae]